MRSRRRRRSTISRPRRGGVLGARRTASPRASSSPPNLPGAARRRTSACSARSGSRRPSTQSCASWRTPAASTSTPRSAWRSPRTGAGALARTLAADIWRISGVGLRERGSDEANGAMVPELAAGDVRRETRSDFADDTGLPRSASASLRSARRGVRAPLSRRRTPRADAQCLRDDYEDARGQLEPDPCRHRLEKLVAITLTVGPITLGGASRRVGRERVGAATARTPTTGGERRPSISLPTLAAWPPPVHRPPPPPPLGDLCGALSVRFSRRSALLAWASSSSCTCARESGRRAR